MPAIISQPNGGAPTSTGTYVLGSTDSVADVILTDPGYIVITGTLAAYFYYDGHEPGDAFSVLCTDPIGNPPPIGAGTLIFTINEGDEPTDTQTMTVTVVHAFITPVAAEVLPTIETNFRWGVAGDAITLGETVYLDAATRTYKLADSDSAATAAVTGMALTISAPGQPIAIAFGGSLDPGFTVTPGAIYIQSTTPGRMALPDAVEPGEYTFIVGLGVTPSKLKLVLSGAGVAAA